MKKSSFIPLVLIIAFFLSVPVAFWVITMRNSNENVRGVGTQANTEGVLVKITSEYGNWDMAKYLCKSKDECLLSLVSGKGLDTTSGGSVKDRDIVIEYTNDWVGYEYLKIFLRAGWSSQVREFKATKLSSIPGMTIEKMTYGGSDYNVVLVPITGSETTLLHTASFSDL